jgi:hypothetical protein
MRSILGNQKMTLYVAYSLILAILAAIVFGILRWLQLPTGNLVDWLTGIASFWWLMAIVTVPWNIYFEAKEVVVEAKLSQEKEIFVDRQQVEYAKKVAKWSSLSAIVLHLISAATLYFLAATGISPVGYISAAATLLLTFLRPAVRLYEYLATRLATIRQQIKYPREDVVELRYRVQALETTIKSLDAKLDPDNADSLVTRQQEEWRGMREDTARIRALFEQLQAKNQVEHERLAREARENITQLSEDSQFLGHVREIIRFFKTA